MIEDVMARYKRRKGLKRHLTKRRPKPPVYRRRKYNRKKMWTRQKYRCGICRRRIPPRLIYSDSVNVDHIVPRARGGLTTPTNLSLVHQECNNRKGSDCPCDTYGPKYCSPEVHDMRV